jgi:uncharacterized protein with ParB-like and HNH nuclease domain
MSFQTPITVKEAINNVHAKKYLLPAIQRELVWYEDQIELLFDSLMRDYPVGSFLFWYVDKQRSRDFQFYEFIRNFHERDSTHNPKASVSGEDDVTAILDGQQRLTSLYIGLRGSYAYKEKMKRWDNDAAFPERKLYLNLLQTCSEDEIDKQFDFLFLTDKEAKEGNDDEHYWFRVGDVLNFKEKYEISNWLIEKGLMTLPAKEKAQFANKTLFKLYSVVHEERVINYFLEKGEELDKVLNIFVRVNSGGTPLSHSDLLLSIASANWQEKDARDEITKFVSEIENMGNGFAFNKDFVLKTCLVLCDFADVAFKVDNFNKSNMLTIEKRWEEITEAIRLTVALIAAFGYDRETLTSNNALIPIAYYLLKKENPSNFVQSSRYQADREKILKWLTLSLLKRAFSGSSDTVLRPLRQVINKNHETFPLNEIVDEFRGKPKSITFNSDEIETLFDYKYGSAYTFSTLALLYPTLDFRNKFHLDHIFPKSGFGRRKLAKRGIQEDKIDAFMQEYDYLANLQLIEGTPNMEKSNKDFKAWLEEKYPTPQMRRDYMEKHYIPDVDLSLDNFDNFINERTKLIRAKFESLLKL